MLLIYSPNTSSRLSYTVSVLFKNEVLVTQDAAIFLSHAGARINYSEQKITPNDFQIIPQGLLFQDSIHLQKTNCFEWKGIIAFFKTNGGKLPFDIFSAAFYLLSRYEEYLPYAVDEYGRYAHTNSLAFKNNFLHLPLIQLWQLELEKLLQNNFQEYSTPVQEFAFLPTYDIDIAYSYLHQPIIKNLYGFFRDLLKGKFELFQERANVYSGNQQDPFDQYHWLDLLHEQFKLNPIYFFLLAKKRKYVDKNISPTKKAMQELIKKRAAKYQVAIHPSWQSADSDIALREEIKCLSEITNQSVDKSRQHYLRMTIPDTYRRLLNAGILEDYTLGYAGMNGFRASYAGAFKWYDLKNETVTALEIHPFCYMDATAIFEQRYPVYEAKKELQGLYDIVKKVKGEMICIFHNHFLTDQPEWVEWKKMYANFLKENFDKI